jgi:hypothetical protein
MRGQRNQTTGREVAQLGFARKGCFIADLALFLPRVGYITRRRVVQNGSTLREK